MAAESPAVAALPSGQLETLVAHVQGLSTAAADVPQLHGLLKQADEFGNLRRQPAQALTAALAQLHPQIHSLGYLYILENYLRGPNGRDISTLTIVEFIETCKVEQIRLAPEKFMFVCRCLKEIVMHQKVPLQGVGPLQIAVSKLQVSKEQLTAIHPDYLVLCLLARTYKAALSVLEGVIFEVDAPKDLFLYCYYGGMIYIGLKQFPKALEYLHIVFTAPMAHLNAMAVEAYKKYILVSLIHNGQVPQFPKYTSASAQRNLKNFCPVYVELSTAYETGNAAELAMFIESNAEKFKSDSNLGLAKQVLSSLYKRNIQKLTQTYLTLSLKDIANIVQLNTAKEAELHVLRMIQGGEIFATINQKDGMVSFHEDPEEYKTSKMVEQIDSSIERLMTLSKKLTVLDEHLACDPGYLSKVGRERQRFDFDDFDPIPHRFM